MVNGSLHRCCEAGIVLRRKLDCGAAMRHFLKDSIHLTHYAFYMSRTTHIVLCVNAYYITYHILCITLCVCHYTYPELCHIYVTHYTLYSA